MSRTKSRGDEQAYERSSGQEKTEICSVTFQSCESLSFKVLGFVSLVTNDEIVVEHFEESDVFDSDVVCLQRNESLELALAKRNDGEGEETHKS